MFKKVIKFMLDSWFVLSLTFMASICTVVLTKDIRDAKEKQNSDAYGEICDDFIKEYVIAVSFLKDFIERSDSTDALIYRVDSLVFGFCGQTDLLEYNIYALDRNLYWDRVSCNKH